MPISALVVTAAPHRAERVLRLLESDPRFTCGEPHGCRIPVALETATLRQSRAAHEALLAEAAVQSVDVVSVDFSDETS